MTTENTSSPGRRSAGPAAATTSRHRRRFGWRQARALLSLGVILGLGSVGTLAYWSDTAAMKTGSFSSGTLDVKIAGNLAGQGGQWVNSDAAINDLLPGDSYAFSVPVERPANTTGSYYSMSATADGGLAPYLRWTVYTNGTASNSTPSGNEARKGSCSGSVSSDGKDKKLTTESTNLIINRESLLTPRTITETKSDNVCVLVQLPSDASNDAQGKSTTAVFTFSATQVK